MIEMILHDLLFAWRLISGHCTKCGARKQIFKPCLLCVFQHLHKGK